MGLKIVAFRLIDGDVKNLFAFVATALFAGAMWHSWSTTLSAFANFQAFVAVCRMALANQLL